MLCLTLSQLCFEANPMTYIWVGGKYRHAMIFRTDPARLSSPSSPAMSAFPSPVHQPKIQHHHSEHLLQPILPLILQTNSTIIHTAQSAVYRESQSYQSQKDYSKPSCSSPHTLLDPPCSYYNVPNSCFTPNAFDPRFISTSPISRQDGSCQWECHFGA